MKNWTSVVKRRSKAVPAVPQVFPYITRCTFRNPAVPVILIQSGSLFVDLSRRFYTTKLSCKEFIPTYVQLKKPAAAVLLKMWCWFSDSFIRCVEVK